MKRFSFGNVTVAGSSHKAIFGTLDTIEGYEPIGIVGTALSYADIFTFKDAFLDDGGMITAAIRNDTSTQHSTAAYVDVLYLRA